MIRGASNSGPDCLADIYAAIPKIECKGKCQECCGPVLMSSAEAIGIAAVTPLPAFSPTTLTCSKLRGGRCSIYDLRPLICRLWGTVKAMQCPYGCKPDRWLSDKEASDLLCRARVLR